MGLNINRRNFLKFSGTVTLSLGSLGFNLRAIEAATENLPIRYGRETLVICPYCSVGCGLLVHSNGDQVTYVEGDSEHPINQGALCSKAAALIQVCSQNPERLTVPLYRAPKSKEWQQVSWEWALDKIAENIYYTRERTFVHKNEKGQVVNRTEGIASVGSVSLTNEESYLYQKFLRAIGLVYIEHEARLFYASTLSALIESFGLPGMTNHWIDLKNADVILIMGSNAAENHPISFKWILEAKKKRGAKIIHIDPRFTRTSAKADIYAPIRAGSDLAFLGGMINYIIEHRLYCEKFLKSYTNASFLVNPDIQLPDDLDGIFSGYNPDTRSYNKSTWVFQTDAKGKIKRDLNLQNQYCVFTLLRKQFYRYTTDVVSKITGIPSELLEKIYQVYASTKGPKFAGAIISGLGWTQHTVGTQNIRATAIIQLLLGNVGMPGTGVNALREEANAQGATDHSLLYEWLPGYLKIPRASQGTLKTYLEEQNDPKYIISLLKAFFGDAATLTNDFCYDWLPRVNDDQDYSWLMLFDAVYHGLISGFFAWAENPACSGANATKVRKSLANLDWLVSVNTFDNETASFWRGPNMNPSEINTEVFLLPEALSLEKEGSLTNSGRWMQWSTKAVNPPGQAKSSGQIITELIHHVKAVYNHKGGQNSEVIINLPWNYSSEAGDGDSKGFDPLKVAREINGYFLKEVEFKKGKGQRFQEGTSVPHQDYLMADGSTVCGNHLYCSSVTGEGNLSARRGHSDPTHLGLYPDWAWAWPNNNRILYYLASLNEDDSSSPLFTALPGGVARIFGSGMVDGPFPEHYEPLECPIEKNLLSSQRLNPTIKLLSSKGIKEGEDRFMTCDPKFPIVCTTFRLSEHWRTGVLTRRQGWLAELQPGVFIEMCRHLAENKDIKNGEVCVVKSARGNLEAVAMVTDRLQPLIINDQKVFQVAIPWHFGWMTPAGGGDTVNILTPSIGDANTMIPETKAFLVDVVKKDF